jgi:hypothetical protein
MTITAAEVHKQGFVHDHPDERRASLRFAHGKNPSRATNENFSVRYPETSCLPDDTIGWDSVRLGVAAVILVDSSPSKALGQTGKIF